MDLPRDYDQLVDRLKLEWDTSEEYIKSAEHVCGDVIFPSILELRYAGRKLVQALQAKRQGKVDDASDLLRDAVLDCHRARHDAIDAATSKMLATVENACAYLGYDVTLKPFPELPVLLAGLLHVQEQAEISRGNRNDRDKVYATINAEHFPKLLTLYRNFRAAEPMMKELARKAEAEQAALAAERTAIAAERADSARTAGRDRIISGLGWLVATLIALAAWLYPRAP